MDQVELLTAIIEASIALIGFSGVVVILGRDSSGEWLVDDRLRLIGLLGFASMSLASTLFALVCVSSGLAQSACWVFSSLAWLILVLPFMAWFSSGVIQLIRREETEPVGRWTPYYFFISLGVVVVTAGLQVANAAFLAQFWTYFLGLTVLLMIAVLQFIRLFWFGLFQSQGAVQAAEVGSP